MSCDTYCCHCGVNQLSHYCPKCFPKVSQQELEAARAELGAKDIAIAVKTRGNDLLLEQLDSAKAQIADYEAALEKIAGPKLNAPRPDGYLTSDELRELANDILNKWKSK